MGQFIQAAFDILSLDAAPLFQVLVAGFAGAGGFRNGSHEVHGAVVAYGHGFFVRRLVGCLRGVTLGGGPRAW